ncbi:MAG: phytanoyl-CoA dioxygenase family protein [Pseudomonadota bacterium]
MAEKRSERIRELGLEPYVMELEADGLTVVPPEVHGFPMDRFDDMIEHLLTRAEEMIGCKFTLDKGPHAELKFASNSTGISEGGGPPNQFLIQQLARQARVFRDLALNPVAVALIQYMIGQRATRFSSNNSFLKWQGDYGYGPALGLHVDQTALPLPWGRTALTANTNWCLTDYTFEGGALAYVPGSHRTGTRPDSGAAKRAVPVEAPKGSVIIFHGATWHGAFPRQLPGMRISIANYYRHAMVTSQEDIQGTFPQELADDCDNPALFKALAGFEDEFPYKQQRYPLPSVVSEVA